MITLPIWLFIICVIIGFPLVVGILAIIGYVVYIGVNIVLTVLNTLF